LNDAIFKTLEEVEKILNLQEIYDYIVKKGYYTWSGDTARTALNSIGRTLNEASKTDTNIVKIANSKNVFYYNKVHESNLDVERKKQELETQDKFIPLRFTTAGCVELLMSVLEFNTESNKKGFPDPKLFNFYSSEMKSTKLIYTKLKEKADEKELASQYTNHLTKLELLDAYGNLTDEGKHIVEHYSEADFTNGYKKMELDSYIFNFLLDKTKANSFINKKAKEYVPDKIINTVNVYNAIPREIRDSLLSDCSPENLAEVLFLQRIYFNGNEISRYYRLEEEDRKALKKCWDSTKASMPTVKPIDLSSIENTIFDYVIFDKLNKMQPDVRYRSWANLKAYDDLIRDNPDNKLIFLNNEIVVDVDVDVKQETKSMSELVNLNKIEYDFELRNILLKGVPGTGKSYLIDEIIKNKLSLENNSENVLRINIHSASSNADLVQGIGISTTESNQIEYKEKQGLIFGHIRKACFAPNQAFVLILEEIQENSLNELIGDLIYLIEPTKRAKVQDVKDIEEKEYDYQELIKIYLDKLPKTHFVKIPFLVSTDSEYRQMIFPDNLYVFCTSNYRDDKKVIEDNLLRRFDVIEVYPQYTEGYKDRDKSIPSFLKTLNEKILEVFTDNREIHPDRFLIGHANWLHIGEVEENKEKDFYKALLKVVIEFKEIREIDFDSGIKKVFDGLEFDDTDWLKEPFESIWTEQTQRGYKELVQVLQCKIYGEILKCASNKNQEKGKSQAEELANASDNTEQ